MPVKKQPSKRGEVRLLNTRLNALLHDEFPHWDTMKQGQHDYWRRKYRCLSAYAGGGDPACACPGCGETALAFLSLEHVKGDGGEHRTELAGGRTYGSGGKGDASSQPPGGGDIYQSLARLGYPQDRDIVVMCMNCNVARSGGRPCPHQYRTSLQHALTGGFMHQVTLP